MLDIDDCDYHSRRQRCQQISCFRIHIQKELQEQKQQNAEPQRYDTDDCHAAGICDYAHHFILTVQISVFLSLQPSQILLNQSLVLLRLGKLLKSFFHFIGDPLHKLVLLITDPARPLHKVCLAVLQLCNPSGTLFELFALLWRKRFNFLHILEIGSHHFILIGQILQLLGCIRHLLQTVLDIVFSLFLVLIIDLVIDFSVFPLDFVEFFLVFSLKPILYFSK